MYVLLIILVRLFTEEEVSDLKREFDFRERLNDSSISDSSVFTVHNLETENSDTEELSKSVVLAPYNTNESDEEEEEEFIDSIEPMIMSKRTIKFASKIREVNRQYEKDNNSNINNGIYLQAANPITSQKVQHKKCPSKTIVPYIILIK